jgi:Nuclease A inhibitor-like protein
MSSTVPPINFFHALIDISKNSLNEHINPSKRSNTAQEPASPFSITKDNAFIQRESSLPKCNLQRKTVFYEKKELFNCWINELQPTKAFTTAPASTSSSTILRPTEIFRRLLSYARYNEQSVGEFTLTPSELAPVLAQLGKYPSPARIVEIEQLYKELTTNAVATNSKTLKMIKKWLNTHSLVQHKSPTLSTLQNKLLPITSKLLWPSESDRLIRFFSLPPTTYRQLDCSQPITSQQIRRLLNEPSSTSVEEFPFASIFERLTTTYPEMPELERQHAEQFSRLYNVLSSSLFSIQAFKVGDIDRDLYIVGRTSRGELAGIVTSVVET